MPVPRFFGGHSRADFAASYPEGAHKLGHELVEHPMLELEALAQLAELLPASSIEYNRGDVPVGLEGKAKTTGLTIGETIRGIDTSNSWAVLKRVEQVPTYRALMDELLGELRPIIEHRTGRLMKPQGFIFISSPDAVTPYHFDPEHNILLQLRGEKTMTIFPAGSARFAPDEVHETYHRGGKRELAWQESFVRDGVPFRITAGEAIYVPVMAPHFVRNGPKVSISLSITWRSDWSFAEADARAFNGLLRRWGINPKPPKRWPASNSAKALAWRIVRKMPWSD
ncbi:cupin-like domain-containing protein [Altererythrobacter sp. KTW20L]|uniref:cupin-like domain-containing protein n=1 Tax=Altererythrobacter sp. KTW20L TaxID=2942210 RepID=UPI0020BE7EB4|nr:cupin-like domain-containing protein [Altererythrobacter sp. KTW20L]MCL6249620.1 cupin-like domain-containing protein [Altererythrobacter sp. KTW20L]